MKRLKKTSALVLALVLCLALLAACGGGGSSSTAAPAATSAGSQPEGGSESAPAAAQDFSGVTLSFISPGAVWTDTVVEKLPEFKEATGITVDLQQLANDQISNKIAISSAAGGKDLDAFAFRPLQETLMFTNNQWLEPLDAYIAASPDFDIDDFYDSSMEICQRDGVVYGIPNLTEREVVFYNTEMFEAAGITELPVTLDDLMETAAALTDASNGVAGIAVRGKGSDAVTQFSGFLRAFGGDFIVDGKAAINTPEALEAFEYYGKLLREYGPAGAANMGWSETLAVFTQGKSAMRIDCDSQFAFHLDESSSLIADKVGYFMMPEGPNGSAPFSITAWALGISPGSLNKDAAWEFVKWSMSKEFDIETQVNGGSSPRQSTWENPAALTGWPEQLSEVVAKSMEIGYGTDRPYMINVGEARTFIGEVITDAILGNDIAASAEKNNALFQELLDKEAAA